MNAIIILVVAVIALGGFGAVVLRLIPPPGVSTLLHIRNGSLFVSRGHLRGQVREDASEVLRGAVTKGFIAITKERRIIFSRHIPPELHQRLRNVLLN